MRMVAAVVVAWLLSVATAWAQSDALLVLPVTVDDDVTWMPQAVRDVSRGLRRQGVAVWQEAGAVAAFEARGSASPTVLTDEAIEAWSSEAGGALRSLAKGNEEDALVRLEAANAFARASIAALGRDSARSTQVVDTCLYLVRAKLAVGDEAGADAQASECVRLQTSVEPTWRMHPPQVVDRYQAAKDEPHDRSILVESDPSGCAVRVNGSLQGRTPLEVEGLYPGPYAVQVECEEDTPGRVHEIDVTRGATSLFVFDAFDRAVRTAPVLHLTYTEEPSQARLARDARQFMSTLPASGVVIASRSSDGEALTLSLLRGTGADRTFVRVPADGGSTDPGTLTQAAAALVAGECRDFAVEPVASLDCRTGQPLLTRSSRGRVAESKPRRIRPPRGQFVAGVTLAAAGTTSLLAGYGLLIGRRTAGESWLEQPSNLSRQDRWLRLGTGVTTTGAAGGGLLVAAMPLVLPYQSKTPWWAWLHGGLGVAAAVGSIVSAVTASPKPPTPCSINGPDPAPCVNRERDTDRAILLGATAAPLLTVPLVYLFRRDRPDRRADILPSVVVARSQGALSLRGTF